MSSITTVIPTFQRPHLIGRAINSVLAQTYPDVLVCVYDNASHDGTEDIVRALAKRDRRVIYECHPSNIGMTANYNYGLSRVSTSFYSVLGDDDYLLPHHFQDAMAALGNDSTPAFFCAPTFVHDEALARTIPRNRSWHPGFYPVDGRNVAHMARDHFIGNGVVYRRIVLETVGFYDRFASDRSYVILAAAHHPFVVSTRQSGILNLHPRGFSSGGQSVTFESGVVFSHGISYAIEERRELMERLARLPIPELTTALDDCISTARRDFVYLFATRSLQGSSAPADAAVLLGVAGEFRFPLLLRMLLHIASHLFKDRRLARLVGRTVSVLYRGAVGLRFVIDRSFARRS
jgi:glycosyltransferase involved in cell wall biosynthesis